MTLAVSLLADGSGRFAAIIGLIGTIAGAIIGGAIVYAVGEAQRKREIIDRALVSVDLALGEYHVVDISADDRMDKRDGVDRTKARLKRLEAAQSISDARRSLAQIRARFPSGRPRAIAESLDRDLSWLTQRVTAWYALVLAYPAPTGELETAINVAFDESVTRRDQARAHLEELREEFGRAPSVAGSD
jgi:hypothetical protein